MRIADGFVGLLALTWGCGSSTPSAPQIGDCVDMGCAIEKGDGGRTLPVITDEGGRPEAEADVPDIGAVGVNFIVAVTQAGDPTFLEPPTSWVGRVTISAFAPSGALVSTPEGGVPSGSRLEGIASGPNWFAMQDAVGNGFSPTLEPFQVDPAMQTVSLTALRTEDLRNLQIENQRLLGAPLPKTARILLAFTQKRAPLRKVSITKVPAGSTLAYDTASNVYSETAATTGPLGSVLLDQIAAPDPFPAVTRVSLQASVGGTNIPIDPIPVVSGFVTWMSIDVP